MQICHFLLLSSVLPIIHQGHGGAGELAVVEGERAPPSRCALHSHTHQPGVGPHLKSVMVNSPGPLPAVLDCTEAGGEKAEERQGSPRNGDFPDLLEESRGEGMG